MNGINIDSSMNVTITELTAFVETKKNEHIVIITQISIFIHFINRHYSIVAKNKFNPRFTYTYMQPSNKNFYNSCTKEFFIQLLQLGI